MKKIIALCAIGALTFAACGDDDDSSDTPATTEATVETEAPATANSEADAPVVTTANAAADTDAPAGSDA